jgi:hypothetical protein
MPVLKPAVRSFLSTNAAQHIEGEGISLLACSAHRIMIHGKAS